ncbi:uncharacterized protein [Branchiostoma lanceolatum]|uniref:uncharacterized protein n=1 Tax=Branchiostoma lanceolatum TaxID=7740 RepID=UPI0034516C5D
MLISKAEADALLYYLGRRKTKSATDWEHEVFQNLSVLEHKSWPEPFGLRGTQESKLQTKSFQRKARGFECVEGELRKQGKLVMIKEDFPEIMRAYHDNASHPGITAMKLKLSQIYDHYDSIKVADYVNNCSVCRTYKSSNTKIQHNQPISINRLFRRLGIDFASINFHDGTPKRRVLYAIDYFSRFAWGWVMPTTDDTVDEQVALTVAKLLLNLCLTLGIVWEELQSDNGSEFVSHVVRELMKALGVKIVLANPRSPTTGGRFERGIQTIKTKVSALLAQNRLDSSVSMTPQEVLQKALYDYNNSCHQSLHFRGRNLCPVDVWYPLYKTRRHQIETINTDSPADLLTTYADPPIFNSDDMEEALAVVSCVAEAATVASLVAEGKIATRDEQVTHFVKAGDEGYLKLDINDRRAAGTDRRQVRVRVLDVRHNKLTMEVLDDVGETTGMVLQRNYHVSQLIIKRQSQEPHSQDGTESGMAAWRQLYGSQRQMTGRVLSACLHNKGLLFYASELDGGAATFFSKNGEGILISWYQSMQSYMWTSVPPQLQAAFQPGVVVMLITAFKEGTLALQVPAECPDDIRTYQEAITKCNLPYLSSDRSGELSACIVPVALIGIIWPQLKDSRLQELSVYLHVPASHKCDICQRQRPMWKYWRCTACNASCCMECTQVLQT